MISVDEALAQITGLFAPLECETVGLREAAGRVLARDIVADRDQPPYAAASMDGYAVADESVDVGSTFHVVGESAAGSGFEHKVVPGQAVRIFTGAPVPEGTIRVIMQEGVSRDADVITLLEPLGKKPFIRPKGDDFSRGQVVKAPLRLTAHHIALIASMNIAEVPVTRRPVVALVTTGNELVMPGETPGPDQIIASNIFALAALFEEEGAEIRLLPIVKDTPQSLKLALKLSQGADMVATIGGTSVGDYDVVQNVAQELGLKTKFYKVAMRPGKPLMAGRLHETPLIGLPGNPVASMVCGHIYLRPAIRKMLGLGGAPLARSKARLTEAMRANGDWAHYMRATVRETDDALTVTPADRQDSALMSVLADANALLVRPPEDPAKAAGDWVEIIRF